MAMENPKSTGYIARGKHPIGFSPAKPGRRA